MSILTPETGQPPMYLFVGHLIVSFRIQLADCVRSADYLTGANILAWLSPSL